MHDGYSNTAKLAVAIRRALLLSLALSTGAWAQSNPASPSNDQSAQSTTGAATAADAAKTAADAPKPSLMGEVKVIGYRTSAATSATGVVTDIVDTPISISAINSQFLKDTGSSQIMDAIGSLTGVTGQNNSGETGTNFGVRGYAITPQIDGFDSLSIAGGLGSTVGIDRIEVLKGPSAVFNGNVPPGGSINIIYKKPSFTADSYVEGEVGSYSYRSGEFFSTGPLIDNKLAYLVDIYAKNADGWVNWTGQKERTAILGLTYRPTDALSITLNYRNIDSHDQVSTLPVSHEGFIGSGLPQNTPLDPWVAQVYGPNEPPQTITVAQYLPGGSRYNVLGPQNYNNEQSKFWSTELSYALNDHVEIRDNFGHVNWHWNFLSILQSGAEVLGPSGGLTTNPFLSSFFAGDEGGSGWENKLEAALYFDTGIVSHSMLIGYQAEYSSLDFAKAWANPFTPTLNAAGQPWDFFTDGPLLLQNQFNAFKLISPAPDLLNAQNTGHQNTHAYYVAEQMSMFEDRLHALLGVRYTKTEQELLPGQSSGSSDTTPQIGLLGKPFSPDSFFANTSFFVNYSKSFVPSGILQPGTTQLVPPSRGTGKEFGFKTSWLDGAISSTVSFFRDDLSGIATPDYSQQGQSGTLVNYNLGGVGRSQGMEADVTWLPMKNLQFSANFTNLPVAKYLDYPGVPQQIGLRFPSTPRQAENLTVKYTFDEGSLSGLYLGGWLHSQSETRGVLAADWHYDIHVPSLTQVSAFAGYAIDRFDLRLNVENLTDRSGYVMNNAFQPQAPRSVYLTLKYKL